MVFYRRRYGASASKKPVRKSTGFKGYRPKPKYKPRRRAAAVSLPVRRMVRKAVINSNATRYLATESYDEVAPHAIQLMSLAYETGFFLGSALPANWSAQNWKAMGGISINKGTAEGWRTGTQVYLKNTMIQMQIDMGNILNQNSVHPILEFRLIVFKNKGIQYLAGGGADPATHLLLNSANEPTGSAVSNINGTDLILNKTNKRNFTILRDQYFRLSHPAVSQSGDTNQITSGFSSHYPSMKRFRIYLPHNKKCIYDEFTDVPTNYSPNFGVVLYARSLGKDNYANNYEVNLRGCTHWTDI